jgi:fused signal recognition particle receptor
LDRKNNSKINHFLINQIAKKMFDFIKKKGLEKKDVSDRKTDTLRDRLIKSRNKLGNSLSSLLLGKKEINDELFDELEMILISSDIGVPTTEKILESVRKNASRKALKDSESLYDLLKQELSKLLLKDEKININVDKPFVILVVGVNGVGKTTTIGKMAKSFQKEGRTVMLAAGDTFRAAAVDQLKVWGERNKITVVSQKTGADSASVIYDAYESAKAKNIDVLIADTAGRLHTQGNLMKELEKIKSVLKKNSTNSPQETMLVIDGGSGQNAINQAKEFNKAVELTSISVTKLDGTAKGGVLFAISDELKLPIRYIGVGEGINDLKTFSATEFTEAIFE